jgi:N-methylhydantoinase A/oxoprolinase/acetone carboxylase beta subunit
VGPADLRVGVDVGATNTDAVLMDGRGRLVAKAKAATTGAVGAGIAAAVGQVVAAHEPARERIAAVMVGTRELTDAVVGRRGLRPVAVLRIGSPLTHAVPPLTGWPAALRDAVLAGAAVVRGGAEYDASAAAALDEQAVARFACMVAGRAGGVAISCVFSPIAPDHERAAAAIVRRELGPAVDVSLSHEVGSGGLLERENATVLNAALVGAAGDLARALGATLASLRLGAEPFLAQSDGSVMALEHALRFPVTLVGAGPANGIRGAAYLSGVVEGVVADVGGASTDVGVLVHALPRQSPRAGTVAGVRAGFRMPDVLRLPFGGGSAAEALATVDGDLSAAVERLRAALAAPVVVAVGGAQALVPDTLSGAREVVRPPDGDVAGAVGLATARVSGLVDRICAVRRDRGGVVDRARADAVDRAVHAGADPGAVQIVEVEEIPLSYLLDCAVRIRVRAAGPPLAHGTPRDTGARPRGATR